MASDASTLPPLLIEVEGVAEMTGLSVRSIWRFSSSGKMPKPIAIGGKAKRWSYQELLKWVEERCPSSEGGR